jgi:Holliday junction resolvase
MPVNSRSKGCRGELEVAALFKRHGFDARRGQQFSGGNESPDVVHGMSGFHVEVKRVQAFNLYKAMEQAMRDKKPGDDALIFHRKNGEKWVVVLDADVFLGLMKEYVY